MRDLRLALRSLSKNPGFTLVAALTLAIGVGATTIVFTIVNGIILRPLEYPHSDRIVNVWEGNFEEGFTYGYKAQTSPANFMDWRRENTVFESMALWANHSGAITRSFNFLGKEEAHRVTGRFVSKVFFTDELETYALSDVHLKIDTGEFVSIAGPSGCGKSTLLSIMGLLDTPTEGDYYLDGRPVANLGRSELARIRNREIGFIFQSFNLIGDLSVEENVELPLVYGGMPRGERKRRVEEVLERVEMSHRRSHLPGQLSGGQQQRVAVARALTTKAKILLADEPTGNLDSKNGDRVMNLLTDLHKEGATICMVTHDERFNAYADRVIHVFDGKVLDEVVKASDAG